MEYNVFPELKPRFSRKYLISANNKHFLAEYDAINETFTTDNGELIVPDYWVTIMHPPQKPYKERLLLSITRALIDEQAAKIIKLIINACSLTDPGNDRLKIIKNIIEKLEEQ